MAWKEHIKEWCDQNNHDPKIQENVLKNKGWDPQKYDPSMKAALFDYLKKWNTLSVKALPKPATDKRRNPIISRKIKKKTQKKFTQLASGWKIWTFKKLSGYSTIASNGRKYLEFSELPFPEAESIHEDLSYRLDTI